MTVHNKLLKQHQVFIIRIFRKFSKSSFFNFKVALCGAAGGVGQNLALLLKQNSLIKELGMYDIASGALGVADDVSHISTHTSVKGYCQPREVDIFLKSSDIVVVLAGSARRLGMEREDLFNSNAVVMNNFIRAISRNCPKALIAIITNPVNSLLPLACEILKKLGTYDPKRIFGVTTLDTVRARTFIGQAINEDPKKIHLPIIGGHSGKTIVPVFSQCKPALNLPQEKLEEIVKRLQTIGTSIVKEKASSSTLSAAYASSITINAFLRGLSGANNVIKCSYIENPDSELQFLATPILLGKKGVEKNFGVPKLNEYEKGLLDVAYVKLKEDIQRGINYANNLGNVKKPIDTVKI